MCIRDRRGTDPWHRSAPIRGTDPDPTRNSVPGTDGAKKYATAKLDKTQLWRNGVPDTFFGTFFFFDTVHGTCLDRLARGYPPHADVSPVSNPSANTGMPNK